MLLNFDLWIKGCNFYRTPIIFFTIRRILCLAKRFAVSVPTLCSYIIGASRLFLDEAAVIFENVGAAAQAGVEHFLVEEFVEAAQGLAFGGFCVKMSLAGI